MALLRTSLYSEPTHLPPKDAQAAALTSHTVEGVQERLRNEPGM